MSQGGVAHLALGAPLFAGQDSEVLRTCLTFSTCSCLTDMAYSLPDCFNDAMMFFRSRQPALASIQDVSLCVELFVRAKHPVTAFEYVRKFNVSDDSPLLNQFFRGKYSLPVMCYTHTTISHREDRSNHVVFEPPLHRV